MATLPVAFNFNIWVELFGFFITFLISTFSFYAYLITKQRRHQFFCIAFLFLSGGILLSALFNNFVELESLVIPFRGYIPITYGIGLVFIASMFLTLSGFMTLFVLSEKIANRRILLLLFLFVSFAVIVAHEYFIAYYMVQLILIFYLFSNYLANYHEQHTTSSLLVMLAFGGLLLAQVLAALIVINYVFYTTSGIIRVLSYILFLSALVSIYLKK